MAMVQRTEREIHYALPPWMAMLRFRPVNQDCLSGLSMESDTDADASAEWMKETYSFCPKCGGALCQQSIKSSEPDRLVCLSCQFILFLDPKVAVGTIIAHDGGIVLVKRAIQPAYGKWVFPGGFVDRGERAEEAAIRETREESCLDVRISRLLNVYSYADYPVIIIVYVGEIIGGQAAAGMRRWKSACSLQPTFLGTNWHSRAPLKPCRSMLRLCNPATFLDCFIFKRL
jgi:ADP-ribose pyrophosphatase